MNPPALAQSIQDEPSDAIARRSRALPWLIAALGYATYTILETWPLVARLRDVIPSDLGDPVLNTWIIWWNAHAVPFTTRWWNAPAFWPSTGVLAFSEVLLGLTPITNPIQWMGGSAITAYNVAFLLTFPLSALAAHALVYRLTGRHDAGVVAGLVYGFNPFRIAHFPQIQVMTSYWMPLALLGLHGYLSERKRIWLVVFAASWLLQALSNGYYLLFFPVLIGVWILWFTALRLRTLGAVVAAFVLGSLPLVPLLWTYRRVHSSLNFQRDIAVVSEFGADVVSLLDASPLLKFWHLQSFHRPEGELFPGFTAAVLVALLAIAWLWSSERISSLPRTTVALLAAAVIFTGLSLTPLLFGPWSIRIGRLTLVSVRVSSKPLSIGAVLLVIAIARLPRVVSAWRRRSTLMFYVLAMGLMYLLCFGPQPHFLGVPFMYRGPYNLLLSLPGYDAIRVPARFAMLAALCLSVVAALAFARFTEDVRRSVRIAAGVLVVCGIIADTFMAEMPLQTPPRRMVTLESLPPGTAVMELPLGDLLDDVAAMYRGMFHGLPVVNGYSGFFPKSYDVLHRGLDARDPQMFDSVAAWGPIVAIVNTARDAKGEWVKQIERHPNTMLLGEEEGWKAFLLQRGAALPADIDTTARLPIHAVSANVNQSMAPFAIDGDPATRWDSGPQRGAEEVTIDLGADRFVDGVSMTVGGRASDFPRTLAIDTSDDEVRWTTRWEGSAAVAAFAGAVRHPREMPLTFPLPHVPARWVRLRQLGQDPVFYWSIFELSVLGR